MATKQSESGNDYQSRMSLFRITCCWTEKLTLLLTEMFASRTLEYEVVILNPSDVSSRLRYRIGSKSESNFYILLDFHQSVHGVQSILNDPQQCFLVLQTDRIEV